MPDGLHSDGHPPGHDHPSNRVDGPVEMIEEALRRGTTVPADVLAAARAKRAAGGLSEARLASLAEYERLHPPVVDGRGLNVIAGQQVTIRSGETVEGKEIIGGTVVLS